MADQTPNGFNVLISKITKIAPLLGTVLGFPGATAIGQIVATMFGGDINNPTELAQMIDKDPESAVKVLEIQSNLKIQLEQIAAQNALNVQNAERVRLEQETARLDQDRLDRQNARALVAQSYMPSVVSWIVIIGFFAIIFAIIYKPLTFANDSNMLNLLFLLFGTTSSLVTSVVAFWVGSSSSSRAKDVTIGALSTASPAPLVQAEIQSTKQNTQATEANTQAMKKVSS